MSIIRRENDPVRLLLRDAESIDAGFQDRGMNAWVVAEVQSQLNESFAALREAFGSFGDQEPILLLPDSRPTLNDLAAHFGGRLPQTPMSQSFSISDQEFTPPHTQPESNFLPAFIVEEVKKALNIVPQPSNTSDTTVTPAPLITPTEQKSAAKKIIEAARPLPISIRGPEDFRLGQITQVGRIRVQEVFPAQRSYDPYLIQIDSGLPDNSRKLINQAFAAATAAGLHIVNNWLLASAVQELGFAREFTLDPGKRAGQSALKLAIGSAETALIVSASSGRPEQRLTLREIAFLGNAAAHMFDQAMPRLDKSNISRTIAQMVQNGNMKELFNHK